MKFIKKENILKIIFVIAGLGTIFFLSFQYAFLTDFPIGHDAGHHVQAAMNIEKAGFFHLNTYKSILYPISITLFAFFHKISHFAWPPLFLYIICLFLFLTAIFWSYFTTKITNNWLIGVTSGIFLVSSRWLSDALRIGFFAETWGWFVFILCSYFLVRRKFWLLLFSLILLFFSHPLVLTVFILVMAIYLIVLMVSKPEKEDKLFVYKVFSLLFLAAIAVINFFPEKIQTFSYISQSAYMEGARSLKDIMIDSDKRRILIYLIGLAGIVKSIQFWHKNEIKFLYVLLFVSIILTQLYLWGINFWVFRFYPYFEMSMAAFAAIGLYYLIDNLSDFLKKRKMIYYALLAFLVAILILPNIDVNKRITLWEKSDYKVLAICPPADREAFEWVKNNLPKDAVFLSAVKWGAWLGPLSERKVIENDQIFGPDFALSTIKYFAKYEKVNYVYFSKIQLKFPNIEKNLQVFEPVYEKDGVRIYKIKEVKYD